MVPTALIPTFHEDWFCTLSQEVLAGLGRQAPDGEIVEIGSWEGRSTIALANAVHPRIVHCVDTWDGSPGEPSAHLARGRDVFGQFQANIDAWTDGNISIHRGDWRHWQPETCALVFIDATHTRSEVAANIATYLPLMVSGGIICGDDMGDREVRAGICDILDPNEVDVHASLWIWRKP